MGNNIARINISNILPIGGTNFGTNHSNKRHIFCRGTNFDNILVIGGLTSAGPTGLGFGSTGCFKHHGGTRARSNNPHTPYPIGPKSVPKGVCRCWSPPCQH